MKPIPLSVSADSIQESEFAELIDRVIERLQRGESADLEAVTDEHPQHAESLRAIWPSLQLMGKLKSSEPSVYQDQPDATAEITHHQQLGDFRILRQIGRGGMGVVYEAEQISMGRSVALKVLPFAAVANPTALQRFKNEVRSAATLNHTNIVPVFSIGEERGIHYFAMQLVRGQTLADLITRLRKSRRDKQRLDGSSIVNIIGASDGGTDIANDSPCTHGHAEVETNPKAAATTANSQTTSEFFRSVAQLGVQAGRALEHAHQRGVIHRDIKPGNLMLDAQGHIYITDFGLARIEADAGITMTGDLVGTLRYMSPEQAMAKRIVVDNRTDVYSLGATLYELLTFEPAVCGDDRQEILRRIAFEEPRVPRSINRAIPVQLETIALKALAKDPAERYESANELADDLQRFLNDQPIIARKPNWRQQTVRWSRRHRTIVASAAVILILTVLGLTVFSAVLINERNKLSSEQSRSIANLNLANANLDTAMDVLDEVYLPMIEDRWTERIPTAGDRQLIENGLAFYLQLAQRNENATSQTEIRRAKALRRMGQLQQAIADDQLALQAFSDSAKLLQRIHANQPNDWIVAKELAESRVKLIGGFNSTGDHQRALEIADQGVDSLDAESEHRESDISRAKLLDQRATCLLKLGRFPEALESQRDSAQLFRSVIDDPNSTAQDNDYFVGVLMGLSDLEFYGENKIDAIETLEEALGRTELLDPNDVDSARMYVLRGIGVKLLSANIRLGEAEKRLREARALNLKILEQEPGIPDHRAMYNQFCNDLGNLAWMTGQLDVAEREFRHAAESSSDLADDYPQSLDYQVEAGQRLREFATYAGGLSVGGMPPQGCRVGSEEVVELLNQSLAYFELAVEQFSGPNVVEELAMTQTNLAIYYGEFLHDKDKESEHYKLASDQWLRLAREFPDSQDRSRYLMRAGMTVANLAIKRPEGTPENIAGLEQGIKLQFEALQTKPVFQSAAAASSHYLLALAQSYLQREISTTESGLPVMDYPNAALQAERMLKVDPDNEFGHRTANQIHAVEVLAYATENSLLDQTSGSNEKIVSAPELTQRAQEIIEQANESPISDNDLYRLACKQHLLGSKHLQLGDPALALDITMATLSTGRELANRHPTPKFRDLLIQSLSNSGNSLYTDGQYRQSIEHNRLQIAELKSLLEVEQIQLRKADFELSLQWRSHQFIEQELVTAQTALVGFLCFCPDASLRDPTEGLEIASQLWAGTEPEVQQQFLYGTALCRVGKYGESIERLENCSSRTTDPQTTLMLNLVLAQAYLGHDDLPAALVCWQSAEAEIESYLAANSSSAELEALLEETRDLIKSAE